MANDGASITVQCGKCGEQFEVLIGGVVLETVDITCDHCGSSRRLSADEIEMLIAGYKTLEEQARAALDALKRRF